MSNVFVVSFFTSFSKSCQGRRRKNLNLLHHIENRLNYLETLLHTFDNIFLGHTHTSNHTCINCFWAEINNGLEGIRVNCFGSAAGLEALMVFILVGMNS